jgi:hypothetical protein
MQIALTLGPPIDRELVVENTVLNEWFEWSAPRECLKGCTLTVPVTIRKQGADLDSTVIWGVGFAIWVDGQPNLAADDMTLRIFDSEGEEL